MIDKERLDILERKIQELQNSIVTKHEDLGNAGRTTHLDIDFHVDNRNKQRRHLTDTEYTNLGALKSSGILGVANGGTGATTLTGIVLGNGTSAFSALTYVPWTDWTPTWDTNGAGTLSSTAVSFARYKRFANIVYFKIDATNTIASTDAATTAIRFTLPVNTTAVGHIFTALVKDPGEDTVLYPGFSYHIHSSAANKVFVYRTVNNGTNSFYRPWTNGVLREVWVQGFYEIV